MDNIIQLIANDLVMPPERIKHTIAFAPLRHRKFKIPKKSGGTRTVVQPAVALKPILEWVNSLIILKLPVHTSATAFRAGKSILNNAQAHGNSKYSVRVDILNFFPSIQRHDLATVILSEKGALPAWASSDEGIRFLSRVCFDNDGKLPIGYLTSPAIANAVMYKVDRKLAETLSNSVEFGKAVLTRYADDFVFSTDLPGACNRFVDTLSRVLMDNQTPQLEINVAKTRYMSRGGGSTLVTGLRVNNDGNIVVHANYRDHVRLLMKLYRDNQLKAEDVPRLIGHLAYIQHVNPTFFTKLAFKYHGEINRLRSLSLKAE